MDCDGPILRDETPHICGQNQHIYAWVPFDRDSSGM